MKYLSRPEELVLLTIWKMRDEPYSVNIRKLLSDMTGKYWSIGSVYVPLDRLEAKGFVTSYLANPTPERGGKSKRYYNHPGYICSFKFNYKFETFQKSFRILK